MKGNWNLIAPKTLQREMRQYNNFDEIERDLKLLKLQSEIDKERIFLSFNHTKESLNPVRILKRGAGTIFNTAMFYKVASKVLGFIGDKLHKK